VNYTFKVTFMKRKVILIACRFVETKSNSYFSYYNCDSAETKYPSPLFLVKSDRI